MIRSLAAGALLVWHRRLRVITSFVRSRTALCHYRPQHTLVLERFYLEVHIPDGRRWNQRCFSNPRYCLRDIGYWGSLYGQTDCREACFMVFGRDEGFELHQYLGVYLQIFEFSANGSRTVKHYSLHPCPFTRYECLPCSSLLPLFT